MAKSRSARRRGFHGSKGLFTKMAGDLFQHSKKSNVKLLVPSATARKRAAKYGLPSNRGGKRGPHVSSTKIDPRNPTHPDYDLVRATQDARRWKKNMGEENFAAYKYIDKHGNEQILVTHSKGTHSERVGGAWLLEEQRKGNIKEISAVYTERAPCSPPQGYCDEWLSHHIAQQNPNFRSLHSFNYGTSNYSTPSIKADSRDMRRYLRELRGGAVW